MTNETLKNLTENETELLKLLREAENPEEMIYFAYDLLMKMLDKNSTTSKIIDLILKRYSSLADFTKAAKMSGKAAADIISGKTEPTHKEVILIAEALNKEPEEIAEIFIAQYSK